MSAELALHCRRQTRGAEVTEQTIGEVLELMRPMSNTLGVPILDWEEMCTIWQSQKRHLRCIQDVEGVQLYTQTGTLEKGGVTLPTWRCARGTTSVESYHATSTVSYQVSNI